MEWFFEKEYFLNKVFFNKILYLEFGRLSSSSVDTALREDPRLFPVPTLGAPPIPVTRSDALLCPQWAPALRYTHLYKDTQTHTKLNKYI